MIHLPYPKPTKSHNTDRVWDTTRQLCQALAESWSEITGRKITKVFVYDVAIQFAALFDTPEELAELAETLQKGNQDD